MIALLEQLGPRDIIALVVIVVSAATMVLIWWRWPSSGKILQRRHVVPIAPLRPSHPARGNVFARSTHDGWGAPPYDWARRPAARGDLGLTRK